jgi:uncharacterized protein YjbI with pentapeptide repeats
MNLVKLKNLAQILIGFVILFSIIFVLWKVPEWQVDNLKNVEGINQKEIFEQKNEARKTIAQILGGFALLVGIYFTWRRIAATERNLEIARDGQITERFTRAIEQLGNEKLEVRMGGIYALERIARDSEKDYWPIMEVLTAYVRANAPWPPEDPAEAKKKRPWAKKRPCNKTEGKEALTVGEGEPEETKRILELEAIEAELEEVPPPDADIQAILTVIGRRSRTFDKGEVQRLDLSNTDLRKGNLIGANLEGAILWKAHLEGADLDKAHLEGAYLEEANMEGAFPRAAYLEGAFLREAYLKLTSFSGAHLKGADLRNAHLEGADLWQAHLERAELIVANLKGANLHGANLEKANLKGADLEGADLEGANLEGADLTYAWNILGDFTLVGTNLIGVKGLTEKQIRQAIIDENTRLPDYLKHLEKSAESKPEKD